MLSIILNVVAPVFVIIVLGYLLDRKFKLDINTLSKLNFYIFIPALAFIKIIESDLENGILLSIGVFSLAHTALLLILSFILFSFPLLRAERPVLTSGALFYNAGNFGIPLAMLAFGNGAVSVMAVVLLIQNLLTFTLGLVLMNGKKSSAREVIFSCLKTPVLYAVIFGVMIRMTGVELIPQLKVPLTQLAGGLIPVALLTLGSQLAQSKLSWNLGPLGSGLAMRLMISPLLAAALLLFFRFEGNIGPVLVLAAGLPVAVNVNILAMECGQDTELSSQLVFWSTLLNAVTTPVILALMG